MGSKNRDKYGQNLKFWMFSSKFENFKIYQLNEARAQT